MAVFRDDGVRLVGAIDETVSIDEQTMAAVLAGRPSADRPGIVVRQFADGSERLVSVHSLPHYGLKVVLTRDMNVALKPWRDAALAALTTHMEHVAWHRQNVAQHATPQLELGS